MEEPYAQSKFARMIDRNGKWEQLANSVATSVFLKDNIVDLDEDVEIHFGLWNKSTSTIKVDVYIGFNHESISNCSLIKITIRPGYVFYKSIGGTTKILGLGANVEHTFDIYFDIKSKVEGIVTAGKFALALGFGVKVPSSKRKIPGFSLPFEITDMQKMQIQSRGQPEVKSKVQPDIQLGTLSEYGDEKISSKEPVWTLSPTQEHYDAIEKKNNDENAMALFLLILVMLIFIYALFNYSTFTKFFWGIVTIIMILLNLEEGEASRGNLEFYSDRIDFISSVTHSCYLTIPLTSISSVSLKENIINFNLTKNHEVKRENERIEETSLWLDGNIYTDDVPSLVAKIKEIVKPKTSINPNGIPKVTNNQNSISPHTNKPISTSYSPPKPHKPVVNQKNTYENLLKILETQIEENNHLDALVTVKEIIKLSQNDTSINVGEWLDYYVSLSKYHQDTIS